MRALFTILWVLIFFVHGNGQSNIAKIKYEEAEEAYNSGNYRDALVNLEEVQKILGSVNPKILYLRIMSQKSLLEKGGQHYGLLDSLRKATDFYLKNYESNTAVEDKYREIYSVSKQLSKYPASKDEYERTENERQTAEIKKKQEAEAKKKAAINANRFIDSLAKLYMFLPGSTWEEFKAYNSQASTLLTKALTENIYGREISQKHIIRDLKPRLGPYSISKTRINNVDRVTNYAVTVDIFSKKDYERKRKYWMDLFLKNIPSEFYASKINSESLLMVIDSEYIQVGVYLTILDEYVNLSFICQYRYYN